MRRLEGTGAVAKEFARETEGVVLLRQLQESATAQVRRRKLHALLSLA